MVVTEASADRFAFESFVLEHDGLDEQIGRTRFQVSEFRGLDPSILERKHQHGLAEVVLGDRAAAPNGGPKRRAFLWPKRLGEPVQKLLVLLAAVYAPLYGQRL